MKYLIIIAGPTGIGKTAMAIAIARHYQCEIISCDSRQFYREMSIGTAVPSPEELAAVRHHFIHNKSISESYTVGDFEKEALKQISLLHAKSDFVVMAGGSGLYVDAVLKGFDDFPAVSSGVRENLQIQYETLGIDFLRLELQRLDPDYYAVVDTGNPQRMMRALEICMGSGKPYSAYLSGKKNERPFIPVIIGLEGERADMYQRINNRVDLMVANGLIDEVKKLIGSRHLNALQTVGYREIFEYLDGNRTLPQAIEEIKKNTRRFAKRQMTWFRRTDNINWFDYRTPPEEIIRFVDNSILNTN